MTFIYKIYTNLVMAKTENFWPCFILHAYCNLMGPPSTAYQSEDTKMLVKLAEAQADSEGDFSQEDFDRTAKKLD